MKEMKKDTVGMEMQRECDESMITVSFRSYFLCSPGEWASGLLKVCRYGTKTPRYSSSSFSSFSEDSQAKLGLERKYRSVINKMRMVTIEVRFSTVLVFSMIM